MITKSKPLVWYLVMIVVAMSLLITLPVTAQSPKSDGTTVFLPFILQNSSNPESIAGPELVLIADQHNFPARVAAPDLRVLDFRSSDTVNFTVNYNPASCGGNVATWPANAQAAFNYAASIWRVLLNGNRTIVIDACWRTNLGTGVLGSASATLLYRDFTNAPQSNTWYPVSLANQLSGADLNGATAEISANFNRNFTWYLGIDGNTPQNQYDFVSVVLHEIGHGLGFSGSMAVDDGVAPGECNGINGIGCWGISGFPESYDRFATNGAGQNLITVFANNSISLANQLTSNNVFFSGANARAANGGNLVRLYAPSAWNSGSSFSHLNDSTYDGTRHALMTHALSPAESAHHPGEITLGILQDIGWNRPNLAEVFVDVNASSIENGSSTNPFNTVLEGVNAVNNGGIVRIRPGIYRDVLTIRRPMELRSTGGIVTIDP